MKLLNWQTERELDDPDLQKTMDFRMEDDLKLGRPSRLEENDQEESKLAKSNHFLSRKLLIDGNKAHFVVHVSTMNLSNCLTGLNKMYNPLE